VRWAGEGRHVWSVRVDLIAPDGDGSRVAVAHESLFLNGRIDLGHDTYCYLVDTNTAN
jgi:hypothetical protein